MAANVGVFVIPGVELSTPEGHLLCYLPSYETLQRFHAQVSIVDRGTGNSRCQNAMLDCLNKLDGFGGFGVLAHANRVDSVLVEGSLYAVAPRRRNVGSDVSYSNSAKGVVFFRAPR